MLTGNLVGLAHKYGKSKVHDFEITQVEYLTFHLLHQDMQHFLLWISIFPYYIDIQY